MHNDSMVAYQKLLKRPVIFSTEETTVLRKYGL